MGTIITLFIAGAIGGLLKEIIDDNKIKLPEKINKEISLGFIGSVFIGGIAGYLIDGNPVTAFLAGYSGLAIIQSFIKEKSIIQTTQAKTEISILPPATETIEQMIRRIAAEYKVDPDLAVRVAKCESGLKQDAKRINKDGSIDRGLYQWNSKWHPEITDEMAYNPIIATRKFCEAVLAGNLKWWNASKNCWNK